MEGHEQLGAQEAVARLLGPHVQPLTLLELAHTQLHHASVHLHITSGLVAQANVTLDQSPITQAHVWACGALMCQSLIFVISRRCLLICVSCGLLTKNDDAQCEGWVKQLVFWLVCGVVAWSVCTAAVVT